MGIIKEKLFDLICESPAWRWFPNNAEILKFTEFMLAKGITASDTCLSSFEWIFVGSELPPEDLYVLVWHGGYQIAKLARGISKDERSKMRAGELDDPVEEVWSYNTGAELVKRSSIYKACDEHGNNTRPYCWYLNFQGNSLFGQNVTHWAYLPENPYLNKKE